MDKFKGILFAALSAATFGLIPLYANQAILDGVFNETILVYRYGIAGIVYAIYLLLRRMNMRLTRREVKEVSLAGVGGYGITAFFLMWSYHYMPTGVATAIHFFYPVVVALLMAIFYKERLPLEVKAGIVLAICGVYLLSWTPGEVKWLGLFFVLMSTVTYGCYITALNRPVLKRMNPDVLTCYVLLFTALFYLILAVAQGKMEIITRPRFLLDRCSTKQFQSALPRGERHLRRKVPGHVTDFNPRSREGSDRIHTAVFSICNTISIRAPARGATQRSYPLK